MLEALLLLILQLLHLTGVSSTSAVGSLGFSISPVVVLTGQSATSSVGTPLITQASIGLTGLGIVQLHAVGGIVLDALSR